MTKQQAKPTVSQSYRPTPFLQKLIIVLLLATYLIQAVTMVFIATQVYSDGVRISPFLMAVAETVLLPLIMLVLAYAVNPEKRRGTARLFVAALHTMIGMVIAALFHMVSMSINSMAVRDLSYAALVQIMPAVIALAVYVVLLAYSKKRDLAEAQIPSRWVRTIFVVSALLLYAGLAGTILYRIASQLPHNPNLSGFVAVAVESVAVPAVIFAIAYAVTKTRGFIDRVFESGLWVVVGSTILTLIGGPNAVLFSQMLIAGNAYYDMIIRNGIAALLAVIITTLLFLRNKKLTTESA